MNNKDDSFNTEDDPIRKYLGPAEQSHPEELKRIIADLENSGVKIIRREGAMAYSLGISIG